MIVSGMVRLIEKERVKTYFLVHKYYDYILACVI